MPTGIYKRTKEHNEKISKAHRGNKYSLGYKHSEEAKKRMSASQRKRIEDGLHNFNIGRVVPDEIKQKISESHRGNKNPNWRGGFVDLSQKIRTCFEYRLWRSDVFTRDCFTCQECGDSSGGNLESHHIKALSVIISDNNIKTIEEAIQCEELWNINNGQTLCKDCHHKTDSYGVNLATKKSKINE